MKYQIIWNGEIIETTYDKQEAVQLRKEYVVAFNDDNVYIRVVYL